MILSWILVILASYGSSSIVSQGSIFRSLREIAKKRSPGFWGIFWTCHLCLGFWAGLIWGAVLGVGFPGIWAAPFVAAGTSHFLAAIQRRFDISLELEPEDQTEIKFL